MDKQKLKELSLSIDFSEPYDTNIDGHRAIYDYLDRSEPEDASPTIPPWLAFYAARNILFPSFIVGQTPDLLNLLTAIETFRRFAVLKSDEALEWQKQYERKKSRCDSQEVRFLAANEVRTLRCYVLRKDDQRREYVMLIRSLILFYIHYLWTSPEGCLLGKRLNDFFPGSIQGLSMPSELLFHADLSDDKKPHFVQLKLQCKEWMDSIINWEEKREVRCREKGQSPQEMDECYTDDFRDTFPQPPNPSESVKIFLNKVEDMVRELEQLFPPLNTQHNL